VFSVTGHSQRWTEDKIQVQHNVSHPLNTWSKWYNISILTKLFLALVQCCAMLYNCCKLASCKLNQLCRDSDKLLCLNCSMISYDHYTVSASFKVHLYASKTQPESPNNFLFADIDIVIIHNNNGYSSSASHLSRQCYSIYALDSLATHHSSIGCHRLSQSWDLRLVNLLRLVSKWKSGWKAWKGRNLFVVLLMSIYSGKCALNSHTRVQWIIHRKFLTGVNNSELQKSLLTWVINT
jgi:hypothetical protein